ncbi:hypothetical protein [Chroococcidiopsis sp.]|uniref:hypothetical protein n=1 Tax=Chroococcidiopsis sp. TaxID=3088168 RepID=UPI003F3C944F
MPKFPPPHKTPFSQRREREFLYLSEVDALIDALEYTRSPIRNQALAILLFCDRPTASRVMLVTSRAT